MQIIKTINEMQAFSKDAKKQGKTIGFVPTMGYLHQGHLSLIRESKKESDVTVVSVFVNPIQFGKNEDLDKYPRDEERDKALLEKEGVDAVFMPGKKEMYPEGFNSYIEVSGRVSEIMCARSRPGHFRGVATVVAKLFDAVLPDKSYFGQKDIQQAVIIKKMVRDLNFPVDIKVMPIVREKDGLAMSSRNTYLTPGERKQALSIYKSLLEAESMVKKREDSPQKIKEKIKNTLSGNKDVKIDYIDIRGAEDLSDLDRIKKDTLIAIAAFVGKTRLIDNIILNQRKG